MRAIKSGNAVKRAEYASQSPIPACQPSSICTTSTGSAASLIAAMFSSTSASLTCPP